MTEVRIRNRIAELAEACAHDFGRFAFEGFGVKLSDEQLDFAAEFGGFGPRRSEADPKFWWLSGGQRGGKTVVVALLHADGCMYKRGLDNTDRLYWKNYAYGNLAIAPTEELASRLYAIMDELAKGANNAQWDKLTRHARPGAFLSKMTAGKSGRWPIVRFSNGAFVDFRSSEGRAYRLEGGQWWGCSWDEWASQPTGEIEDVVTDVLPGRLRDHDAKLLAMAWPKAETEHHLIKRIRAIEAGRDTDSRVFYLSAEAAYFTNAKALEVERRMKDEAKWKRTVLGQPAGGAAIEFKPWMLENAKIRDVPFPELPREGYTYLTSWDLGAAKDATVGITFRIPIVSGKPTITPTHKARIVNFHFQRGNAAVTIDSMTFKIGAQQGLYGGRSAADASSMGGILAVRQLRDISPPLFEFKARSNDRIYGNMRLAGITNGLDLMTWGRPDQAEIAKHADEVGWEPEEYSGAWGLIEIPDVPELIELFDQLLSFDRDAKDIPDDAVWSLLIGCWYMRRLWVRGANTDLHAVPFNVRDGKTAARSRRLIGTPGEADPVMAGARVSLQGLTDEQKSLYARGKPVVRYGARPGQ